MREGVTVVDNVLFGASRDIKEWVRQRLPHNMSFSGPGEALGLVFKGRIVGGVVFDGFTDIAGQKNITVSAVCEHPGVFSRRTLRRLWTYPFITCGCRRASSITAADNAHTISILTRMGFSEEGRLRAFFPGDTDAVLMGMLREECRWI